MTSRKIMPSKLLRTYQESASGKTAPATVRTIFDTDELYENNRRYTRKRHLYRWRKRRTSGSQTRRLFEPAIGDVVNIFSNDTKTIVQKIEASKVQTDTTSDKVHIHIVNKNESPSYQDLASRQGGRVVNKVIYCVLAFLLGGLGIHKFYAGKIGSGILYLIFCWTFIPGLIALIEFVIALCKPSDSQGNIVV